MAGLDKVLLDRIDFSKAINRIISDSYTDFIFAPHINSIYINAGDFLSSKLRSELQNGNFNFSLPIAMGIPKPSGLTRPGSILLPKDRLLYQSLSDNMIDEIEKEIDRDHVFSNIPSNDQDMFISPSDSYKNFENSLIDKCSRYKYCLRTDVASYFETIYQHFIISQLHSTNIEKGYINLLEQHLLKWREDKSYGLLQGMYPSDLYGNYYLAQMDYYLNIEKIDFVRYVDDIYIFSEDDFALRRIAVKICNNLRQQGLFLNENKTLIAESNIILNQILEFSKLFFDINQMFKSLHDDERNEIIKLEYGFQRDWDEELYRNKENAKYQKDSIIKFCLPLLSKAKSMVPLENIKNDIKNYPHLTKSFASYLASIDQTNAMITNLIEEILKENHFIFEYQQMWMFAVLLYRRNVSREILKLCARYFLNKQTHESIRAICAIILSKKGNGNDRKLLRDEYSSESSIFVKSSILYCTRFLISAEKNACKIAWGTNNYLNELIVEVLKKI
jgi:hypothetical protein